ncbi:MarR family winged helix-turn-helix transcriptional regulator [Pseudonocardia asaccharolytica]|uniref:MarR family winged helix-turn-helix transcriptional regulator n=1 Tax=Pseudonocardia asaccharolytica TaxID=54010 RepID=UPI000490943B
MTNIAEAATGQSRAAVPGGRRRVPDKEQLASWRAFLRAHATITRTLETELVAEQRLSLASYDVLVQLAEAPRRTLRMTELAAAVLLSRSGVTRIVDRLERVGLVRRSAVENDGRGVAAILTEAGLNRLRIASRTHLAGVVTHFADRLNADDLAALERISRRLVD